MLYLNLRKGWTMANIESVYEGKLSNGVEYKVHQSSSLSNKCDLAISINDQYVAVMTVYPKRSGNIEITPMNIGKVVVKGQYREQPQESEQTPEPDLLSDILPGSKPADVSGILSDPRDTPITEEGANG